MLRFCNTKCACSALWSENDALGDFIVFVNVMSTSVLPDTLASGKIGYESWNTALACGAVVLN